MKEVIVRLLVSAGLGITCGLACGKIYDEMEKRALTKARIQRLKESNNRMNQMEFFGQMEKELKDVIYGFQKDKEERKQYIKENMELVRIHGLEKAEQIRWEQMNQPKED